MSFGGLEEKAEFPVFSSSASSSKLGCLSGVGLLSVGEAEDQMAKFWKFLMGEVAMAVRGIRPFRVKVGQGAET